MSNEKILVVDDDKNICELLRLYLVKEGYGVTIANDGTAALQEFDKLHPDLVLLDVMMPGIDGWEVCRKIRQNNQTPIIMLTAKDEVMDKVAGLDSGPQVGQLCLGIALHVCGQLVAVLLQHLLGLEHHLVGTIADIDLFTLLLIVGSKLLSFLHSLINIFLAHI